MVAATVEVSAATAVMGAVQVLTAVVAAAATAPAPAVVAVAASLAWGVDSGGSVCDHSEPVGAAAA